MLILKCITVDSSSSNNMSYSFKAATNIIAVTSSKQCIHFRLSVLWPPTSHNLKLITYQDLKMVQVCTVFVTTLVCIYFNFEHDVQTRVIAPLQKLALYIYFTIIFPSHKF